MLPRTPRLGATEGRGHNARIEEASERVRRQATSTAAWLSRSQRDPMSCWSTHYCACGGQAGSTALSLVGQSDVSGWRLRPTCEGGSGTPTRATTPSTIGCASRSARGSIGRRCKPAVGFFPKGSLLSFSGSLTLTNQPPSGVRVCPLSRRVRQDVEFVVREGSGISRPRSEGAGFG